MVQSLTSLPAECSNRILCYYENATNHVQYARIANIPHWLYERVVFPRQRLLFEALPDSLLEIQVCNPTLTLLERIPCLRLRVGSSQTTSLLNGLLDSPE